MRRLDRAFDRLASRGHRSDPNDLIQRLERRLAGEPTVTLMNREDAMERSTNTAGRRRGLMTAATATAVTLAVTLAIALPLTLLDGGEPSLTGPASPADSVTEVLTIAAHPEGVSAVAWSPDGTRIATATRAIEGSDGVAKVWDATTGDELIFFRLGTSETTRVDLAYSPDGSRLAFGGPVNAVYDPATGEQLLSGLGDRALAYSPDGSRIALGGAWGWAAVIDATTGDEQFTLPLCPSPFSWVWAAAWSPDGTRIATTCGTNVRVWDATTGHELLTISSLYESTEMARVTDVTWSPDGTRIATVSRDILDGTAGWIIEIWDVTDADVLVTIAGHTGEGWVVAWSPEGTRIATAGHDGAAKIWDAVTGDELATLTAHTAEVTDVAWSPDGTRIATASDDGSIKVWQVG